jgi:hypothetical protein
VYTRNGIETFHNTIKLAQRNDFFLVLSHKKHVKAAFQGKFDVLVELAVETLPKAKKCLIYP